MAFEHPMQETICIKGIGTRLRDAGIQPTRQRIAIAQVLLPTPVHMTADEILLAARAQHPKLSRATVYNTLPLLVEKGLLRTLRLDLERTVYDSRAEAHSHIYHEDTGKVEDLPLEMLDGWSLPQMSTGLEMVGLDLTVRVRQRQPSCISSVDCTPLISR